MKSWKILAGFGFLVLVSLAGALTYEMSRSEQEARDYIGSWEGELARTLLIDRDAALLNKILGHVLFEDLVLTKLQSSGGAILEDSGRAQSRVLPEARCLRRFETPITLYGLPAARLEFCEPVLTFVAKGALSPIFLGALLAGVLLVGIFRRETGRWRREKTKLQSRVILQEDLARVSRQVAHDIRSPLSALQMVLGSSSEADERNRILLSAVDRIRGISDDLFKQGKLSLEGSTNVRGIEGSFARLREELSVQFPDRELIWAGSQSESIVVPLRPETWERILQNLLRNACEALGQAHEKKVVCRAEKGIAGFNLTVWDSGPGVPAVLWDQLGREGFSREKTGGTGLGLAFVRRHVESAGGAVEFARPWSGGFEVRITCPILRSENPVHAPGSA